MYMHVRPAAAEGRPTILMSPPCLGSEARQFEPTFLCLLSCSSVSLVDISVLSCSAFGRSLGLFFSLSKTNSILPMVGRLFCVYVAVGFF